MRRIPPAEQWKALSRDKRRALIAEWEKLDETTRPAFPVYRDSVLDPSDNIIPALTGNK